MGSCLELLICFEFTIIVNFGHCVPGPVEAEKIKKHIRGLDLTPEPLFSALPLKIKTPLFSKKLLFKSTIGYRW